MSWSSERVERLAILLAWMGLIFFLSSQEDSGEHSGNLLQLLLGGLIAQLSSEEMHLLHTLFRKLAHFCEFGILGLLWFRHFSASRGAPVMAWALASLYALVDEYHQTFVPGRVGAIGDAVIDSSGALIFILAYYYYIKHAVSNQRSGPRRFRAAPKDPR